jgi:hypothetical protein
MNTDKSFKEVKEELLSDPKVKTEYDELSEEYEQIHDDLLQQYGKKIVDWDKAEVYYWYYNRDESVTMVSTDISFFNETTPIDVYKRDDTTWIIRESTGRLSVMLAAMYVMTPENIIKNIRLTVADTNGDTYLVRGDIIKSNDFIVMNVETIERKMIIDSFDYWGKNKWTTTDIKVNRNEFTWQVPPDQVTYTHTDTSTPSSGSGSLYTTTSGSSTGSYINYDTSVSEDSHISQLAHALAEEATRTATSSFQGTAYMLADNGSVIPVAGEYTINFGPRPSETEGEEE